MVVLSIPGVVKEFWKNLKKNPSLDTEAVEAAAEDFEAYQSHKSDWIQYALIAEYTGIRPCLRCPKGVKAVTLKVNEVYKYGITRKGAERYNKNQYRLWGVRFEPQHRGTFEECEALEAAKIIAYKASPERFKPEVELVRPPGNGYRN